LFYPEFWVEEGTATIDEVTQIFQEMYIADQEPEGNGMITGFVYNVLLGSLLPGMHYLNGAVLDGDDYPLLYAAIASPFKSGGNINLPNFRGRAAIATGTGVGMTSRWLNQSGGEETHQLTVAELAEHSHEVRTEDPTTPKPERHDAMTYVDTLWEFQPTELTGGDDPHNNMQPWATVRMAIYTDDRP
jgi:microcystin-dependent protein